MGIKVIRALETDIYRKEQRPVIASLRELNAGEQGRSPAMWLQRAVIVFE